MNILQCFLRYGRILRIGRLPGSAAEDGKGYDQIMLNIKRIIDELQPSNSWRVRTLQP
jgi:hypothetical protein